MKIIKPVLFGALLGAGLFYLPFFILRVALFFLIIGGLLRLFRGRFQRGSGPWGPGNRRLAMAEKVRAMSDEEFVEFKSKVSRFAGPDHKGPDQH